MPKVSVENTGENPVLVNLADGTRHRLGVGQGAILDLTEHEIKSLEKTAGYTIGKPSKAGAAVDDGAGEGDGGAEPVKAKSAGRPKKDAADAPALPGTAPAALPLPGTN